MPRERTFLGRCARPAPLRSSPHTRALSPRHARARVPPTATGFKSVAASCRLRAVGQIEWSTCADSDSCFDLLSSGATDVLPIHWAPGAAYRNGVGRTFLFSASPCASYNSDLIPYVLPTSTITTTAQLIAALKAGTATLVAQGAGTRGELR